MMASVIWIQMVSTQDLEHWYDLYLVHPAYKCNTHYFYEKTMTLPEPQFS